MYLYLMMYSYRTATYLFSAVLFSFILALPPLAWSEDRYDYPYTVEALGEYSGENKTYRRYESQRHIEGKDIVIFGSEVTIKTPLLSNGGDVLIFTDHLHLEAPIDTRVYFDHGEGFFDKDGDNGCRSIHFWLKGADTVIDSYEQFYRLSDDIWDDHSKSYSLKPAIRFPEAPAGMTLCANKGASSSGIEYFPIQVMKWENIRSGNITIFAHSISFCPKCGKLKPTWNGVKVEIPEIAGQEDVVKDTTFFNARGIRGSRGGMPFWGCEYRGDTNPEVCSNPPNQYRRGPFRGGDAGNVSIYLVNNEAWFQKEQQKAPGNRDLSTRIGITGGQQGAQVKLAASCFSVAGVSTACPKAPDRPTRKIWEAAYPEEVWPDAPKAQDGTFLLESLNSDEALSLVSLRLHEMGGKRISKRQDLQGNRGHAQSITRSGFPTDHLTTYLLSTLQRIYLNTTQLAMDPQMVPLDPSVFPHAIRTIFHDKHQPFTLSAVNLDLYYTLAQFHFYRKESTLNSYLRDIGGLLNLHDRNPRLSFQQKGVRKVVKSVPSRSTIQPENKGTVKISLMEEMATIHDVDVKRELHRLDLSLSRTVKHVSNQEWYLDVSEVLDRVSSSLLNLTRMYAKHQYAAVRQEIYSIGEQLLLLDKKRLLDTSKPPPPRHQFPIFGEYRRFLESLETMKREISLKNDPQFRMLMGDRSEPVQYRSTLSLYKDFLRLAMIDEIRRGTSLNSPAYFRDLVQLEQLVWEYPRHTPLSHRGSLFPDTCPDSDMQSVEKVTQKPLGNPVSCMMAVPSKTHWTELRVHPAHKILGGLVLYRFAPGAMRQVMNIGKLFYDYELKWDTHAPRSPY